MDIIALKEYLYNDPSLIMSILENTGCQHIKHVPNKRIECALPDGDNRASVQVILKNNALLNTVVHTRKDYDKGDLFNFVEYIMGFDFSETINWVRKILNLPYISLEKMVKPKFIDVLDSFTSFDEDLIENVPLSETAFHSFIQMPHKSFVNDGILAEIQDKMQISYDIHDSRILIPIRDIEGNLITFKGRTIHKNYKELDIPKYMAYYEYNAKDILYGYYENYWNIMAKNEVIVVESEKAVLQAMSMGIDNVVALSKSKISEEQLNHLLSLQCDMVLALDKDIEREYMIKEISQFENFCNKYIVYDKNDLLEEKQSPFDAGRFVWDILYDEKEMII